MPSFRAVSLALLLVAAPALAGAQSSAPLPRPEFPQPQFERKDWLNLNGPWRFAFDDGNAGLKEAWYGGARRFDRQIVVPFAFESPMSGIGDPAFHPVVWYQRDLTVPASMEGSSRAPEVRGGRLPGHGLAERPEARRSRGRQHPVRLRRDRPPEGRRQRPGRPRRRPSDRPLRPARQAVLEGEVREHLLHPHHRYLADGVARGRRRQLPVTRAYAADHGWGGALRGAAGQTVGEPGAAGDGESPGRRSGAGRGESRRWPCGPGPARHRPAAVADRSGQPVRRDPRTAARHAGGRPGPDLLRLSRGRRRCQGSAVQRPARCT